MILQKYKEVDGIKVFHDAIEANHVDYNPHGLDVLYAFENKHFWFIARREFIYHQMQKTIDLSSNMIEVGAGTGNISRYLKKEGYQNISVGEMHMSGLKYAKSHNITECYQFDLLRTPFQDEFTTVCMFDVLEHIQDDFGALNNVSSMLKDKGYIVLTVPAHQWLWNYADIKAGHKRRYTKHDLISKLENTGFEIVNARYFFISITPLLLLRRFLNKSNMEDTKSKDKQKDMKIQSGINKILLLISRIENKLNKYLPNWFGGSLFIIARKR